MNFSEALEKLNGIDLSDGKSCFICERNDPQNYMEVSASLETHNDRQYVNTEFKVFNQGVQQQCDVFPHGKFTHYTRADGSNSTDQGEEHWDKMKQQMQEKGGFGDDLIFFPDVQSYQRFITDGQIEIPEAVEIPQQEQSVSPEAEKLFEAFQSAENETNVKIAKQQDIINSLNEKIRQTEASQSRQFQTVAACEDVLKSNAYPKLNPLISAFSEKTKKSAERKNDKIADLKKKVKKAQKKMKRLKRKQQKNKLLKSFISSLFDKNADRSAYITAMQALREDSLIRAEKKLDKTEQRLEKARSALGKEGLSNVDMIKLKARIKKLEGRKETLEAKINNLTELDQSLNKLAKMEVVEAQLNEIKEVTLQGAAGSTTISEAVDGMTSPEVTSTIEKVVTGEVKEEAVVSPAQEDETPTEEKVVVSEQPQGQTEMPDDQKNPAMVDRADLRKRAGLSEQECQAVVSAGIPITARKQEDGTVTVVFHKDNAEKVNQALESIRTQAMKR